MNDTLQLTSLQVMVLLGCTCYLGVIIARYENTETVNATPALRKLATRTVMCVLLFSITVGRWDWWQIVLMNTGVFVECLGFHRMRVVLESTKILEPMPYVRLAAPVATFVGGTGLVWLAMSV